MNKTYCFGTDGGCLDSFYLFKELFPKKEIFFLSNSHHKDEKLFGTHVKGPFEYVEKITNNSNFIYQCGSVSNHKQRDFWFNKAIDYGLIPLSLISKFAYIHPTAQIGEGSIIYPGVKIMTNVKIGKNTIILPNAVVNHDSVIGDFSIINSSCVINGSVSIGKKFFLGSSSSIREKTNISKKVTIGMNSMILNNITSEGTYIGIPAKRKI
mgnify:CR=1 FL=1